MGAREISNVLWASATLSLNPDDIVPGMVHDITSRFVQFIDVAEEKQHPNAQELANVLWAFAQLKHAPSQDVMSAMFDNLVALCQTPCVQPNSQNISNVLLACAELQLAVKPTCVEVLLNHFLKMQMSSVDYQHYSNVAWSLAVMQCLDLNTFEALLDKLTTKRKMSSAQLAAIDATQLYQALAWLRPPSGSKQMKAWFSLQSRLMTVAPERAAIKVFLPGHNVMWAALAMQEVLYKAQVQRGVYRAHALLSPCDRGVPDVILMLEGPGDHLVNLPSR